jgi:hypothetical protein
MKPFKNRAIRFISLTFLLHITLFSSAQNTPQKVSDFRCIIMNDIQKSIDCLEFDVYLLDNDSSAPFELASIQLGILVNPAIYNSGTVKATIVEGSSELIEAQQPSSITFAQESDIIKIAGRIIKPLDRTSSSSNRGSIISTTFPGTRICRIRILNTKPFTNFPANLTFNYTKVPYPTTITQYISGMNILAPCTSSNCLSNALNAPLK